MKSHGPTGTRAYPPDREYHTSGRPRTATVCWEGQKRSQDAYACPLMRSWETEMQPLTPAADVWIKPAENQPHVRALELPRDCKSVPQGAQSH